MKKLNIILLMAALIFTTSISYAQENFKDDNLALLENIALNSKYENIFEFMKKIDYKLASESKYDFGEFYYFKSDKGGPIMLRYTKKALEAISITLPTEIRALSEANLKDKNFTKTEEVDLLEEKGIRWKKTSYPFNFYFKESQDPKSSIMLYKN